MMLLQWVLSLPCSSGGGTCLLLVQILATSPMSLNVLIVKPKHLAAAESIFACTSIQITTQGQRHLGAALGIRSFTEA